MSFLLKIVQGPNAGAEVALVEGATLSFGTSTECDIVLADAALAPKAFELEVTQERVVVVLNGQTVKLDPFHVTTIGTTALVIGPAEGAWKTLVWPAPTTTARVDETYEADAQSMTASSETPPPSRKRASKKRWVVLFLLLIGAAMGFAFWKYPERSKAVTQRAWTWIKTTTTNLFQDETPATDSATAVEPAATTDNLECIAKTYGFTLSSLNDKVIATGDFATRAERLTATAQAYAARPGIRLDFADEESLKTAIDQHLELITEGALIATQVEQRKVFLAGHVESQATLETILRSIRSDLPKITAIDCSQVQLAPPETLTETVARRVPKRKPATSATQAKMPIVGILTVPYPCLVLSDGTRAMEGARFGDYTIETIAADHVVLVSPQGSFTWSP